MKKIAIFGATGNTGLCSLEHAVKKGNAECFFFTLKTDKNQVCFVNY